VPGTRFRQQLNTTVECCQQRRYSESVHIWRKIALALLLLLVVAGFVIIRPDLSTSEIDDRYRTNESHFLELPDGTRMHYLEAGSRDAPTLLLVHGSFDSAFTWEQVMPALAADFHIIAPDLPAHGLTGRTSVDAYAMSDMVQAVHDLVSALGLSRFYLAGSSMGGLTAWLYTLAHPEHVERLVLVDAAGYPNESAPLVDHEPGPLMRWLLRYGNPVILVRRGFDRAVADPAAVSDAYVARSVDFLRRDGSRDAQTKRNRLRNIEQQPVERIVEIRVPTLVVWGDSDALLPVAAANRFHAALPNSELKIYPGIGHMPQLEVPEQLVKDMRAFLIP
jgi:pimeloyl-ACP methyl ester carboxylesterase